MGMAVHVHQLNSTQLNRSRDHEGRRHPKGMKSSKLTNIPSLYYSDPNTF